MAISLNDALYNAAHELSTCHLHCGMKLCLLFCYHSQIQSILAVAITHKTLSTLFTLTVFLFFSLEIGGELGHGALMR